MASASYRSEVILADYFDNDAPLETTTGLHDFQALVGYESINAVEFSGVAAVPEPGTGVLLTGGLPAIGWRRRGRSA